MQFQSCSKLTALGCYGLHIEVSVFLHQDLSVTTGQHSVVARNAQAQKRTRWSTIPYLPPTYLYAIYLHTSTIWVVHMGFIPITCAIETWGNWRPNWLWSPKCSKRCYSWQSYSLYETINDDWFIIYYYWYIYWGYNGYIYYIYNLPDWQNLAFSKMFSCSRDLFWNVHILSTSGWCFFFRVPWSNPDIKNTYRLANPRCGDTNFGESCLETPKWPANGPFWNDHIWWWEWWE